MLRANKVKLSPRSAYSSPSRDKIAPISTSSAYSADDITELIVNQLVDQPKRSWDTKEGGNSNVKRPLEGGNALEPEVLRLSSTPMSIRDGSRATISSVLERARRDGSRSKSVSSRVTSNRRRSTAGPRRAVQCSIARSIIYRAVRYFATVCRTQRVTFGAGRIRDSDPLVDRAEISRTLSAAADDCASRNRHHRHEPMDGWIG